MQSWHLIRRRSYWILGAYAPTLSEKHDSFLRLLKDKDFKEESMTKIELDAIGTSTTLESNKSPNGTSAHYFSNSQGQPARRGLSSRRPLPASWTGRKACGLTG